MILAANPPVGQLFPSREQSREVSRLVFACCDWSHLISLVSVWYFFKLKLAVYLYKTFMQVLCVVRFGVCQLILTCFCFDVIHNLNFQNISLAPFNSFTLVQRFAFKCCTQCTVFIAAAHAVFTVLQDKFKLKCAAAFSTAYMTQILTGKLKQFSHSKNMELYL